jgi:acetylornithine deacetylase/succinyl-diaminopimelate desuccinylase-like protein
MLTAQFHKILIASTLVGFCGFVSAQTLTNTQALSGTAATDTLILKAAQASFAEYFDLLALPNDAVVASDIQKNTDWLAQAFTRRGFKTQQLPNNGKPLLFAEYKSPKPDAKTILFYMHLDGQPVLPEHNWGQVLHLAPIL